MIIPQTTMAEQVAEAVMVFQEKMTGHAPRAVTVVLSQDTLVVTLHEALSPAERDMARNPAGAATVQEFHRQLFHNSSQTLRDEIRRITGVEVRETVAQVEPMTGPWCARSPTHRGSGVPARPGHSPGRLEREWGNASSAPPQQCAWAGTDDKEPAGAQK